MLQLVQYTPDFLHELASLRLISLVSVRLISAMSPDGHRSETMTGNCACKASMIFCVIDDGVVLTSASRQ
jgi:hypothetical protein